MMAVCSLEVMVVVAEPGLGPLPVVAVAVALLVFLAEHSWGQNPAP